MSTAEMIPKIASESSKSSNRNRYLVQLCSIVFIALVAVNAPVHADPMIEFILHQFQEDCDDFQASSRGVNDDLDDPLQSELIVAEDAIYEIELAPGGLTGIVLYHEMHCSNIARHWCGTGGCGFHVVVNGVAYFRRGGFRPFSITEGDNTFVLIPIHGSGCVTSDGERGAGVNPCYAVAVWDDADQTFRSISGEIDLSPVNP